MDNVLSDKADKIRERSVMLYNLYEAANVFGLKKFTEKEVREEAIRIYYGK